MSVRSENVDAWARSRARRSQRPLLPRNPRHRIRQRERRDDADPERGVAALKIVHEAEERRSGDDAELIERLVECLGGAKRQADLVGRRGLGEVGDPRPVPAKPEEAEPGGEQRRLRR